MISLKRMRELEPTLRDRSDAEVADIRDRLYALAEFAMEIHHDSKFPVGSKDIDDTR